MAESPDRLAMVSTMGRIAAGIREGAEGLIAWDGRGEYPDIEMERWVDAFGPAVHDEDAWRQHVADEYEATLVRLTASQAEARARRQLP